MVYCKDCRWRGEDKYCNNPHVQEEGHVGDLETEDCLIYCYNEGGKSRAGDNFACIYGELHCSGIDTTK